LLRAYTHTDILPGSSKKQSIVSLLPKHRSLS
jgi:hypothetical protein